MIDTIKDTYEKVNLNMTEREKKHYSTPMVSKLGSIQKITLGGSYLTEDSAQGPGTGPNP